jgi:hypothetical protein
MLRAESSWSQIQAATGCSRATVAKIAKRIDVVKGSADRALVTSGFVADDYGKANISSNPGTDAELTKVRPAYVEATNGKVPAR